MPRLWQKGMVIMMKKLSALIISLALVLSLTACDNDDVVDDAPETAPITDEASPETDDVESRSTEMSGQIRVFENGTASVKLFPDGTFIANLFHNSKITGTYVELVDDASGDIAVKFSYNGMSVPSDGGITFGVTGFTTVVGSIVDNVLTLPEDWDDGHGHGMEFSYRAYPVVFASEDGQTITLNADNTFVASFNNDVKIIGYYSMRATTITFLQGSPSSDSDGNIVGMSLVGKLVTGDDGHGDDEDCDENGDDCDDDNHDDHEDCDEDEDDEDEDEDHEDDDHVFVLTLELPELWASLAGVWVFELQ